MDGLSRTGSPTGVSEKEVRQQLEESVTIAVQRGNADIMLAEYCRATAAAARSDQE